MRIRDAGDHLKVLREAAEHILAILIDFFSGRRRTVLGEHAASGFKGLSRRGGRRFLGQLSKPSLEGKTLRRRSRFERCRLVVGTLLVKHWLASGPARRFGVDN